MPARGTTTNHPPAPHSGFSGQKQRVAGERPTSDPMWMGTGARPVDSSQPSVPHPSLPHAKDGTDRLGAVGTLVSANTLSPPSWFVTPPPLDVLPVRASSPREPSGGPWGPQPLWFGVGIGRICGAGAAGRTRMLRAG